MSARVRLTMSARPDLRVELIRARFEILRRDAEIECLRRRLSALERPGDRPDEVGERRLASMLARLEDECALLERLATGARAGADDLVRARTIAHRPWRDARGEARALLSDEEAGGVASGR
jgi:hypothetical protein